MYEKLEDLCALSRHTQPGATTDGNYFWLDEMVQVWMTFGAGKIDMKMGP